MPQIITPKKSGCSIKRILFTITGYMMGKNVSLFTAEKGSGKLKRRERERTTRQSLEGSKQAQSLAQKEKKQRCATNVVCLKGLLEDLSAVMKRTG